MYGDFGSQCARHILSLNAVSYNIINKLLSLNNSYNFAQYTYKPGILVVSSETLIQSHHYCNRHSYISTQTGKTYFHTYKNTYKKYNFRKKKKNVTAWSGLALLSHLFSK